MMTTPILYQKAGFGPLDHIPEEEQWNLRNVFYVTTRAREPNLRGISYGNEESDVASIGLALVGFGNYQFGWEELSEASKSAERKQDVPLTIAGVFEAGRLPLTDQGDLPEEPVGGAKWLFAQMREEIDSARDKDVLIYVHGANVDFYNACAFAAQLDHFMGRDMTSLAFSWPTRQNILSYAFGNDIERGERASVVLAQVIRRVASETQARKINIVCWSAGGRLLTQTLEHLYDSHEGDLDAKALRKEYRLGTLYFAAADVSRDYFVEVLPKMNSLAQEIVVTGSDQDGALRTSVIAIGGDTRMGTVDPDDRATPEQREIIAEADRFFYVDVSSGSDIRGFDITGHRYWLDHPWANTDMILAIRTDLKPAKRGLKQGLNAQHWIIPEDYPQRILDLANDPSVQSRISPTK